MADTSIYAGGVGVHLNSNHDKNNWNKLIAIQHQSFVGAYFQNSYYQDTFLLGYSFPIKETKSFSVNVVAGAMYGYKKCPVIRTHHKNKKLVCPSANLNVIPKTGRINPVFTFTGKSVLFSLRFSLRN